MPKLEEIERFEPPKGDALQALVDLLPEPRHSEFAIPTKAEMMGLQN